MGERADVGARVDVPAPAESFAEVVQTGSRPTTIAGITPLIVFLIWGRAKTQ